MSNGPLDAWAEVTAWYAELTYSVTDDHDVISSTGNKVVGKSRTRGQIVASGRLVGSAFFWEGDAVLSASWEEETNIDESSHGYIEKSQATVKGSDTGTGTIWLAIGETNGSGSYSISATGLTLRVTTTHWTLQQDPVSHIPTESYDVSIGSRPVNFPNITKALPHSGLVLKGNKRIRLSGSGRGTISWSMRPAPNRCGATLRFLDFRNHVIDPNVQALAVSNHVSDDLTLGDIAIGFNDRAADRSAFRLEVEDPTGAPWVEVELQVGGRAPATYGLAQKSGHRYRGVFLRLVTDSDDEHSLPTSQNILCKLGEKVVLRYRKPPPDDCEDWHEIGIGRPVKENNNDHPSHLKHDIRELKLNVMVFSKRGITRLDGDITAGAETIKVESVAHARNAGFIKIEDEIISYTAKSVGSKTFRHCQRGAEGTVKTHHAAGVQVYYCETNPAATRDEVTVDLNTVDERLAQSGIRIKRSVAVNLGDPKDRGVVLPPALLRRYVSTDEEVVQHPTASERAVAALKGADLNSIDVFYVDHIFPRGGGFPKRGVAYFARSNGTGNNAFQNFIVISKIRGPLTLAHEIMHVLLNDSHRDNEPKTALFYGTENHKRPHSTKRIGPYPGAEDAHVGQRDTETMRTNAETLPQ